ncbi:hypothetical protein HK101_010195 [Irineochytrium annulatum]|nr:hypothetical protein HK101_010195 [Irineochytrium annulatum]
MTEEAGTSSGDGATVHETRIPEDQVNLRLLLVSGKKSDFLMAPGETVDSVKAKIFSSWPKEWTEETPESASSLRILHRGKFLEGNTTLEAASFPCEAPTKPLRPRGEDLLTSMGNAITSFSPFAHDNDKDVSAADADDGSFNKADQKILILGTRRVEVKQIRPDLYVGCGNFGTCIADHLANLGLEVTIWARDAAVVSSINEHHKNSKYMSTVDLSPNLKATTVLDDSVISAATVVIFSIPTQHVRYVDYMVSLLKVHDRSILERVKPHITTSHLTIFLNKGIENGTLLLPCDIVTQVWGEKLGRLATFLSGPSFAVEVVKRQPTCVSVASKVRSRAHRTQRLFHAPHFRVYDSNDVIGVELAGAYKNIIALASGACAGLGFQNNARAAIITRGLAEMIRVGVKLGADPLTFAGLAGVGDLMLTAQSEKSRNYTVGFRLGKGEELDHVVKTLGSVAEGVETTRAAYALCKKLDVDFPVCEAIYGVLFEGKKVADAGRALMGRDPSNELRGIK